MEKKALKEAKKQIPNEDRIYVDQNLTQFFLNGKNENDRKRNFLQILNPVCLQAIDFEGKQQSILEIINTFTKNYYSAMKLGESKMTSLEEYEELYGSLIEFHKTKIQKVESLIKAILFASYRNGLFGELDSFIGQNENVVEIKTGDSMYAFFAGNNDLAQYEDNFTGIHIALADGYVIGEKKGDTLRFYKSIQRYIRCFVKRKKEFEKFIDDFKKKKIGVMQQLRQETFNKQKGLLTGISIS